MSGAIVTLVVLSVAAAGLTFWTRRDAQRHLITSYGRDISMFRSGWVKIGLVMAVLGFVSAPVGFSWIGFKGAHLPSNLIPGLPMGDFPLAILCIAGIYAIAAISLNLLIGYTGQVSLGQAAFMGVGAYVAGYFGSRRNPDNPTLAYFHLGGWYPPPWLWLLIALLIGALISAAIGPLALRLRGQYLAVVSIGILFLADHVFRNFQSWTNGPVGRNQLPGASITIWPGKVFDFSTRETGDTDFFGFLYRRNQGYFWLIWGCVIVVMIIAKNLVRTRQGRAMMAVRDRDISAEVIGVELAPTKIWVFAVSGAMASLAGALYGSYIQAVTPDSFNLNLSIQFVAIIIVGGVGTIFGSVVGAVAVSSLIELFNHYKWLFNWLPFLKTGLGEKGMNIENLVRVVYGLFIILFLMFFPFGIAGVWQRIKRYLQTWPFSS